MKNQFKLLPFVLLCLSSVAFAQGSNVGNGGGDTFCVSQSGSIVNITNMSTADIQNMEEIGDVLPPPLEPWETEVSPANLLPCSMYY